LSRPLLRCCCAFVWTHSQFCQFKSWSFDLLLYLFFNSTIDKLGPVGRWLRHRLLSSILIGTPPLVALQVDYAFWRADTVRHPAFYFPGFARCFISISFLILSSYSFHLLYLWEVESIRFIFNRRIAYAWTSACFDLIFKGHSISQ